ncbi:MAG: prephenate dehydratase [Zetaproteobacteria bacterium]|nr:MAG: prephenate dehydratase [Zetaproteobacteria bacterium]
MSNQYKSIAFQGEHGAYSDMACRAVYPDLETVPCASFDAAFRAVMEGRADLAMIPVDNTIAGRVADVHHLMPDGELFIIGEHFQPVNHMLLGVSGAKIEDIKHVHSHVHAIPQCRKFLQKLGAKSHVHADTAGAAAEIARKNDKQHAAIASSLAAEIYGLEVLAEGVEDQSKNTTRFLILSPEPDFPDIDAENVLTSLLFEVRNIPASLYKALGGFATNGLSITKLESYVDGNFQAARFYCDIEGHPESIAFGRALEELGFFAKDVKLLGAYLAHPSRKSYEVYSVEL